MSCSDDGFGGYVELDIICVEVEAIKADDITEVESVEGGKERTEH